VRQAAQIDDLGLNRLHIDHWNQEHEPVRGGLREGCNRAIGSLYEDPTALIGLARYLLHERGRWTRQLDDPPRHSGRRAHHGGRRPAHGGPDAEPLIETREPPNLRSPT